MTVRELQEALEGFDGETEVRLAIQPNWPFQHEVGEVVEVAPGEGLESVFLGGGGDERGWYVRDTETEVAGPFETQGEAEEAIAAEVEAAGDTVVYIAEAGQHYAAPYLPADASRALGWR